MATIMHPINPNDDPAIDETVFQPGRPQRSTAPAGTDRQHPMAQENGGFKNMTQAPPNADSYIGPPISYRGLDANADPRLHRSFSQRAKSRPFAAEAFADDTMDEHLASKTTPSKEKSVSASHSNQTPSQPRPGTPDGSRAQRAFKTTSLPQRESNSRSQGKTRTTIGNEYGSPGALKFIPRPHNAQNGGNHIDDRLKDWRAPDRSPLQKLEVKLTDISKISKEEKRARVREAETKLRQSHGGQGAHLPRETGNEQSQIAPQSANARAIPGPAETQLARPNQPAVTSVDTNGISNSGRPTERRAILQGPTADIPTRQYDNTGRRRTTTSRGSSEPQPVLPREHGRSVSAGQAVNNVPIAPIRHSQIPRSISLQQQRPPELPGVDQRPISEQEKNASHQATLQQLTGQDLGSFALRGSSQAPQTSTDAPRRSARFEMPANEHGKSRIAEAGAHGPDRQDYDHMAQRNPRSSRDQPSKSQRSQPVVGLGLSSPPSAHKAILQSPENVDATRSRQRRSSVSFKEPFDTRRPVDEWKTADTAQLTADDFLTEQVQTSEPYKPWWEQDQTRKGTRARASGTYAAREPPIDNRTASFSPPLYLKCGPLLRYSGLRRVDNAVESGAKAKEYWRGTVMIVTQDSRCSYEEIPTLRVFSQPRNLLPPPPALVTGDQLAPEYVDPIAGLTKLSRSGRAVYVRPVDHLEEAKDLSRVEDDTGVYEAAPSPLDVNGSKSATAAATNKRNLDVDGETLGRYKQVKGVRLYSDPDRDVTFWRFNIEVELGQEQQHVAYRINKSAAVGFWVPARGQSMNTMFHSCNGFSLAVDPNTFSGPDPLWRDVLNNHQTRPFHVMIGGGDQVYNDRVMVDTHHFGEWTKLRNPQHKHQALFTPEMKEELEDFYLERYAMWFSQGLFGMANASIPMVNIWDDHDIIDGFGSYPDDFMKSPVFMGLGEIAHKYYLLFQHQTVDSITEKDEPSWILGKQPGPYIQRVSRSVYLELGQRVAFLGLDGRTERTRHDVLSIDTLELILERCRRDMVEGQTKHLIVLLGVPIAYPRLVWLENVLTSRALDPIKALHRAGIVKTKLLNKFDGGVEILDDLDDHWTAKDHKDERNILIEDLQDLAAEKSVRITILSGDVHLAAIGQFYSNPKLKIPKDKDHRYMPNIISSAIVNTPPPDMMADVLNKRNKVHHLNKYTDENMIPMFTHDVNDKKRNNTRLLPRRNWCSIREYTPGDTPPPTPSPSPSVEDDQSINSEGRGQYQDRELQNPKRRMSLTKNDFNPRNLLRRLSSRNAPPNAYRDNVDSGFQSRATSLDGNDQSDNRVGQSPQLPSSVPDHVPDVPALRPSMYKRRPTNLSEKAARKGIVPDVDGEGNEIHFNDHVNLEGGLDIVLNCEVNQRDPAGITAQYRLLVPALWYDGSSDREKLDAAPPLARRNTLLQRFGLQSRQGSEAADKQGAGNWGQEISETESDTGDEHESEDPPKKRFSFFGSRRKKQDHQPSLQNVDNSELRGVQNRQIRPESPPETASHNQQLRSKSAESQHHQYPRSPAPAAEPAPESQRPQNTYRPSSGFDQGDPEPAARQPRPQTYLPPAEDRQDLRSPPVLSTGSRSSRQQVHPPLTSSMSQRNSQRGSRPLSYVIGGTNDLLPRSSSHSATREAGQGLYDPDAEYVSTQHRGQATSTRNSNSADYSNPGRTSNVTSPDENYVQPGQRQLRGNGILGKNIPPSSFRNSGNSVGYRDDDRPRPPSQGSSQSSQTQPRGYSGIEAYKEPKSRRRWSLRERARNMMGSVNSKKRKDGDEWYSDEEEEAYWEGQPASRSY